MTLAPGSRLGPYEIAALLGAGGMGVVYRAHDPRLDRHVAIKLLPPDLTRDETAKQRFLQEAKTASALDHPNICTIYDVGETDDGQLYLVMAHYEGETLKERIARGPLQLDDAAAIATQVGEGLAEAHQAGIVHRDIKPANLFLTKTNVAKILDFGLAKLAGSEGVTQTGTTVGTVAYMSPEQAKGEQVDHRTDIWSLGVVLYEMLAGQPPFQGENLLSLSHAIADQPPPPLVGAAVSAQDVVRRSLDKEKTRRYQAVTDLVGDIRRLQFSAQAQTATVSTVAAQRDRPSIAVLPFADMSPAKDQDYFCEGMAEEIINALTALDGLHVASRTSAFKARDDDIAEVGRRLKVGAVLEGSVRKAGDRLRVTAQLIDVSTGYHLWSERYDRDMEDVFAVQDEIARTVVDKLKVRLLGDPCQPLVKQPADNLEAYNLYLRGRYFLVRPSGAMVDQARDCFSRAVALEPTFANAHAGLAQTLCTQSIFGSLAPRTIMPAAKDAAERALALDETVAAGHSAMGNVLQFFEWDWAGAEREYRRALELRAPEGTAHRNLAIVLSVLGRGDEALEQARAAVDLDPVTPMSHSVLATVLVTTRRYDEAIDQAKVCFEWDEHHVMGYVARGWALVAQGRYAEAVVVWRRAEADNPENPVTQAGLGHALGLAGRRDEALAILDALKQRRRQGYVPVTWLAQVSLGLGDREQAISWLQRAVDDRDGALIYLSTHPFFDSLRSDPRFQTILRRMNLPEAVVTPDWLPSADAASNPSIAVLPFRNMSADPEQEYFCEGMAEELIDTLAKLDGLHVVARTSSFQFKGQSPDLREVGSKLNVRTVLEGSVRKAGNRLRVNAQLINAEDGYHLWSEKFDRDMDDVFAVQDEIAHAVVQQLKIKLMGASDAPLVRRATGNPEAYALYLKGHFHMSRFAREPLERALDYFTQALSLDPTYATALASAANVHAARSILSLEAPHTAMPEAKRMAVEALSLDDTVPEGHHVLGMVLHYYEWNGPDAEREYRRALELDPADMNARVALSDLLMTSGRTDESLAEVRDVVIRDPASGFGHAQRAQALMMARRFTEAVTVARESIELAPTYSLAHSDLGRALAGLGQHDNDVVEACRHATIVAPGDPVFQAYLGWALGLAGRTQEAQDILEDLKNRRKQEYVGGSLLASIAVGVGNHDQALTWLETAAEEHDGLLVHIPAWFAFDPLRADPRFQAILGRMHFPSSV